MRSVKQITHKRPINGDNITHDNSTNGGVHSFKHI